MTKNFLMQEKVFIKYLPDFSNGIEDKTHPLYGGLATRSYKGITAPSPQKLNEIFSKEEFDFISEELGEKITARSDFWKEFKKDEFGNYVGIFPIYLKKEGDILFLDNVYDYIKWKILKNCPKVATSYEDAKNRAEVQFLMLKENELYKKDRLAISAKQNAYKLYGKYEDNEDVLRYILKTLNKSIDPKSKIDFLQKEVWKEMEKDINGFISIVEDPYLNTKIKINKFLMAGLINKHNGLFYGQNGEKLSLDGEVNDLDGTARYLESGIGSDFRLMCEAKLNGSYKVKEKAPKEKE